MDGAFCMFLVALPEGMSCKLSDLGKVQALLLIHRYLKAR